MTEYMTAQELSEAMKRALDCEVQPQRVQEIDTAIVWRVLKFARSSAKLNQMFIAYCASYRRNTITADIAIKWLLHNNLMMRFNTWDATDVRHNWDTFKRPEDVHPKAISTKTYIVVGSVDLIQPADKNCQRADCWWAIVGAHGLGPSDGWTVFASPKPDLQEGQVACVQALFPVGGNAGSLLSDEQIAGHYPKLTNYRVVDPHTPWGVHEASGNKNSCATLRGQ